MSKDKVVDRILAMRAKIADLGASPDEVQSSINMVAKLMAKHMISEDDLTEKVEERFESFLELNTELEDWGKLLVDQITRRFGVVTQFTPRRDTIFIIGRKLNVEMAIDTCERTLNKIMEISRTVPHEHRAEYRKGFALSVVAKINKQIRSVHNPDNLPMVNEVSEIEAELASSGDDAKIDVSKMDTDVDSFASLVGFQQGSNFSIDEEIG